MGDVRRRPRVITVRNCAILGVSLAWFSRFTTRLPILARGAVVVCATAHAGLTLATAAYHAHFAALIT